MNVRRAPVLVLAAMATGCVGSCGSSGASSSTDGAIEGEAVGPAAGRSLQAEPPRRVRPPRQIGFTGLILRAGREAELSDESRGAITDIEQKLHDEEPPLSALTDFQTELVAGIRAGKLDAQKLESDYRAIDVSILARQAKQADALGAVHAALDATSRSALVAAARARLGGMFRARPELLDGGVTAPGEPFWVKHRLNRVKAEVGLDEAQQPKVAALLAKLGLPPAAAEAEKELVKQHAEDMLRAFEGESLDVHALDLSPTGAKSKPHAGLERETKLIAALLPILTPEQRERLAILRQRRVMGRWTADPEPWSPFEEPTEQPGRR